MIIVDLKDMILKLKQKQEKISSAIKKFDYVKVDTNQTNDKVDTNQTNDNDINVVSLKSALDIDKNKRLNMLHIMHLIFGEIFF